MHRLSALGATLDEIEAVKAHWDTWDDGNQEISRRDLVRLDDAALHDLLRGPRDELDHDTTTDEDQARRDHDAAVAQLRVDAERVTKDQTVDGVMEWVGNDRVRAEAAWVAEMSKPDDGARSTLTAKLAAVVDSVPAD